MSLMLYLSCFLHLNTFGTFPNRTFCSCRSKKFEMRMCLLFPRSVMDLVLKNETIDYLRSSVSLITNELESLSLKVDLGIFTNSNIIIFAHKTLIYKKTVRVCLYKLHSIYNLFSKEIEDMYCMYRAREKNHLRFLDIFQPSSLLTCVKVS